MANKREYAAANKRWLEEKSQEEGVKALPKGIYYKVLAEGKNDGVHPSPRSIVTAHYTGRTIDGRLFDSSRGEAVNFPVMAVVPGFREMLLMMRPGAKARCIIPGNLAYGERGNQGIAPNETLVFDIETVGLAK
mgnify:CR=1 FL=1